MTERSTATTSANDALGANDGSAALTRGRRELKYLIPASRLAMLSTEVARRVPPHVLGNEHDSSPPLNDQAVTTVYFDTPELDLFHAAHGSDRNTKLRVREYDAVHPEMRALAEREGRSFDALVWLELKVRNGDHTAKRRAAMPKADLEAFLKRGVRSASMEAIARGVPGTTEALRELHAFAHDFGKPLRPTCVVNYVRCAWQAVDGSLRVTVDRDVAFFPASDDQWRPQDLTERRSLGPPAAVEPCCVIEVKTHGELPQWLADVLDQCDAKRVDYSKFVAAMLTLFGDR